jgi:transcription elongation factor Elf1
MAECPACGGRVMLEKQVDRHFGECLLCGKLLDESCMKPIKQHRARAVCQAQ